MYSDPRLTALLMPEPRPATLDGGGVDVLPILARWCASDRPVHVALLPLAVVKDWEADAAGIVASGGAYLCLTRAGDCAFFCEARIPAGIECLVRSNPGLSAFVREMTGRDAALYAICFAGVHTRPSARAGGPWAAIAPAVRGAP